MDELYHFRDHYFENHDISEADVKDERVKQRMEQCLGRLDEIEGKSLILCMN